MQEIVKKEPGHIALSSSMLTPKNRAMMTVHISKSWMKDNNFDEEKIIIASQNAICCTAIDVQAITCCECCGTSGNVRPIMVSPVDTCVQDNNTHCAFFFKLRSVCTSSWKHMGSKQVRLCVALTPCTKLYSTPISLFARMHKKKDGSPSQKRAKHSNISALQSLIPATTTQLLDPMLTSSGLFVVVWIVQISPLVSQQMGLAHIVCGMSSRPSKDLVGHSVQRIWPDPGNQPLVKPVTRWSVMVYSYSDQQEARRSIAEIRSFNQNHISNTFNMNMEAAGLINLIASINSW